MRLWTSTILSLAVVCLIGNAAARDLFAEPAGESSPAVEAANPETPATPDTDETRPAESPAKQLEGTTLQPGDEPLKRFQPRESESPEARKKRLAVARFLTGQLHQERGEFDEALKDFQAAIAEDPESIEPYRSALRLLLRKNQREESRQLVLAAAEANEEGVELLRTLAAVLLRQEDLQAGISLLKEALDISTLKENSGPYLDVHRDLGLFHRLHGDYESAASHYEIVFAAVTSDELNDEVRQSVLLDPGKLYDEFGDVFLKAEKPQLALQAYEEASKYRDATPGLHSYNLATVFQKTGSPDKALEELQRYFDAQLQTRGRAAYEMFKELLAELNRSEELRSRLLAMRESDPHNDVLRFYLADELLADGQLDEAEKLYTNNRRNVTDPRALLGLFSIYRQRPDAAELIAILPKVFQSLPRSGDDEVMQQMIPEVRDMAVRYEQEREALTADEKTLSAILQHGRSLQDAEDGKLDFLQTYLLGQLAAEGHRTDDAVAFYRAAIAMRNDPPGDLYKELAEHLLDTGEHYEQAAEVLQEAISHPSNGLRRQKWFFLYLLSSARAQLGETEKALEAIRESQALQPSHPLLVYQEAVILANDREFNQALEILEELKKSYPNELKVLQACRFRISAIYVEMGEMEKGEQALEEALEDEPDSPQANNDLGYLWADQNKNLEKAHAMISKALASEPDNHAYLDSMGWVLYRQGRYEDAVEYLQKATVDKRGEDSTLLDHLGDALDKVGRKDEARDAWKKALELEMDKKHGSEKILSSLRGKLGLPQEDVGTDSSDDSKPPGDPPSLSGSEPDRN